MLKNILALTLALTITLSTFAVPALAAATLSLNKTNYTQGETITVSYSGVTAEMKTARAWIGIAKQGAAADEYLANNWEYTNDGSGAVQRKAPSENGTYEARFYQGHAANDTNFVKSVTVTFTVGKPIDYKGGTTQSLETTQPATPPATVTPEPTPTPSGNNGPEFIGEWKSGAANYTFNSDGSWSAVFKLKIIGTSWMPHEEYKGSYQISGNVITYSGVEKRNLLNGTGPWEFTTYDNDYYLIGRDAYYQNYGDCLFVFSSPITFDPFTGSKADGLYLYAKGY